MIKSLLLVAGFCITTSVYSQKVAKHHVFVPACDLVELNKAYVKLLQEKRCLLDPAAPKVIFDPNILYGMLPHNQLMEQKDSLYHAIKAPTRVELCGMTPGLWMCQGNPKLVAEMIWKRFQQSTKGHCELQAQPQFTYVAISCGLNYYVVRMDTIPAPKNRSEYMKHLTLLGHVAN